MKRGLRQKSGGFTILETIIVLTVTIALLGSTLALFQQRIPRTQFTKAVNELSVRLTDVANQVTVGNYPGASDTICSVSSGVPTLNTGGSGMGTNQDCIFLGQAIGFGPNGCTGVGGECDKAKVFTIFGLRQVVDVSGVTKVATKLSEAAPTTDINKATQEYDNGYGLSVKKIFVGINTYSGIAYVQSFGSGINASGDAEGSQQVSIIPVNTTTLGLDFDDFAGKINSGNLTNVNPVSGITICLKSGTTNQYAVLVLGANGNATDIQQRILDYAEWSGPYGCT